MKNKRWLRVTGWILVLVMLLTVYPIASFAESNGDESNNYRPVTELMPRAAEVDITDSTVFTYTNESGKEIQLSAMNPNKMNRMKLTISGLGKRLEIGDDTLMTITLSQVKITGNGLKDFSSDAVNASLNEGKLVLSWKNGKQDSLEASFAVLPNIPADNDLSGDYVLITKSNVLVGASTMRKDNRDRITSSAVSVKNGQYYPTSGERSVWTLKHVSGNYYTVYNQNAHQYMEIVLPNHATLAKRSEEDAQKLLVQKTSDGFYTFQYEKKNLNNQGNNAANGFASYDAGTANNEIFRLCSTSDVVYIDVLSFSANGGTGDTDPSAITAEAGTKVTLPGISAKKNGQEFIGWADVKDFLSKVPGVNHTYHDLYKPGTLYTMKPGANTLYAVYDLANKDVQFGIRRDGVIVDEPNDNSVSDYIGHFTVKNILKEGHWVIDIVSTKPVNGYYIENDVTTNLKWVPSAEDIAAALKKEGNVDFDPETQYVHYYVLKYAGNKWKIDGVIRNKANVEITYDANVPGTEKSLISNLPGSYQVAPGTDIMIGADQNSSEVKRPGRKGYYFMGWNTAKDGSGEYYNESKYIHLTENLCLYAQWISEAEEVLEIRIRSDWTHGLVGYVGAKITLFGELTGFEDRHYTLQWQYTTDPDSGNWIDVPDAHELTYSYILDETTTHYTWRLVARDIT